MRHAWKVAGRRGRGNAASLCLVVRLPALRVGSTEAGSWREASCRTPRSRARAGRPGPRLDLPVLLGQRDPRSGGVRVLRDVDERLADDVVDGRLDRLRQPAFRHRAQLYGNGRARSHALEGRSEPTLRQHRRMDPAGQLAQLVEGELELLLRPFDELERAPVLLRKAVAGESQREGERDEPLLGAVVEVALEAPPFLVLRPEEPHAGGAEVALSLLALGDVADEAGEGGRSGQRDAR